MYLKASLWGEVIGAAAGGIGSIVNYLDNERNIEYQKWANEQNIKLVRETNAQNMAIFERTMQQNDPVYQRSAVDIDDKFGFGGITSCLRVSVPIVVVENVKLF